MQGSAQGSQFPLLGYNVSGHLRQRSAEEHSKQFAREVLSPVHGPTDFGRVSGTFEVERGGAATCHRSDKLHVDNDLARLCLLGDGIVPSPYP